MDTPSIPQKTCRDCKQAFPKTSEFFRVAKKSTGKLESCCHTCERKWRRERKKRIYHEDIESAREVNKRNATIFRARHPDKVREQDRQRRLVRFLADPEKERERDRERNQRWRDANPHKHRIRVRRNQIKRRERLEANTIGNHFTSQDVEMHLRSQKGRCWWCGKKYGAKWHIDHRIPLAKGGSNSADNICISCPDCNLRKNDKLPGEWIGRLL